MQRLILAPPRYNKATQPTASQLECHSELGLSAVVCAPLTAGVMLLSFGKIERVEAYED